MVSAVLLLTACIQLACVVLLWTRITRIPRIWLLGLVGIGVAYDSAIVGLGATLGEGALLHALSLGRFVGHALLTPLLVLWAADRTGASPRWRRSALVLTVALVAWGVLTELPHLRLVPRWFADTLRYSAESPAPPVPALVVTAVLLVAGIVLWRSEGRLSPLLSTGLLLLASAAAVAVPPLGNVGEAVMLAAFTGAEVRVSSGSRYVGE
ncbi:hypothetical protein IU486_29620 [Streptomyces gardneri]|uniref:hypothetical protein n=1 Tax=Nocardia TaxID=1817 RepID=UPI00135BFA1C|nr:MULTISPECIES: hypothetical protein [Nocardia]MBF6168870.1 hypothetical protein [Streptomyces gardneri]